MESLSYAEFSTGLHQRTLADRIPLNGTIEVTRRCPLDCCHCYNNLAMGDAQARDGELSYDEHCRVLDDIAQAGCLWLLYTGGEVFARSDFPAIYAHAWKHGLFITLFTNGTLITPEVADHLAGRPPFAIEITMYGRTRETYERVTGVPGSYERCLRAIGLLKDRALPLTLKSTAITLNRHEMEDLRRFVEQDLGLPFKSDAMMNPRLDGCPDPLRVRLTPAEVVAYDLQDPKRAGAWADFARQYTGPVHAQAACDEMYHCAAGVNAFAIDPHGRLSLCVLSEREGYDLRAGTFREGWEWLSTLRQRKTTRPTKCLACQIKAMCGMCPANAELEGGDPESPVDFLCEVAHLRSHVMGLPVPPHGACAYCRDGGGYTEMMHAMARLSERGTAAESRRDPDGEGRTRAR